MDNQALGRLGEEQACAYLVARGYAIVARNVRTRQGEVDIVARQGDVLAFVEVKTRASTRFGMPQQAVDARKQRRIIAVALQFLQQHPAYAACTVRFDVIACLHGNVTHFVDAFAADGAFF
nr:YraN family protein [Maliibacterium massiliense]